jgi:hypothetical protein
MLSRYPGVNDRDARQISYGDGCGVSGGGGFDRAQGWRRKKGGKERSVNGLDGKEALRESGQGFREESSSEPTSARKICADALEEFARGTTEHLGDGTGNLVCLDRSEERLEFDDGVHEGL